MRIKFEDDGRGIDLHLIKRKLVEKGFKNESELLQLSDHEIIQFIFEIPFFNQLLAVAS